LVLCPFSWRELPETKADSFHQTDDFAFLVCQNEMKEKNMGSILLTAPLILPSWFYLASSDKRNR
jgi:hypothetical protein